MHAVGFPVWLARPVGLTVVPRGLRAWLAHRLVVTCLLYSLIGYEIFSRSTNYRQHKYLIYLNDASPKCSLRKQIILVCSRYHMLGLQNLLLSLKASAVMQN